MLELLSQNAQQDRWLKTRQDKLSHLNHSLAQPSSLAKKFKFLLVGSAKVGKSQLLNRLAKDVFDDTYENTIGFIVIDKTIEISQSTITLNIWDCAGDSKYKPAISTCEKNVHAVVFVYDVTSQDSFESIQQLLLEKKNSCEGASFILVANKVDLVDKRVISTGAGTQLAASYNIPYFETSARTNINVAQVFTTAASLLEDPFLPKNVNSVMYHKIMELAYQKVIAPYTTIVNQRYSWRTSKNRFTQLITFQEALTNAQSTEDFITQVNHLKQQIHRDHLSYNLLAKIVVRTSALEEAIDNFMKILAKDNYLFASTLKVVQDNQRVNNDDSTRCITQ